MLIDIHSQFIHIHIHTFSYITIHTYVYTYLHIYLFTYILQGCICECFRTHARTAADHHHTDTHTSHTHIHTQIYQHSSQDKLIKVK